MNAFNKTIRVITIAPVMALALLVILYFSAPYVYGNMGQFVFSIIFLTVLPILAYPLQPFIPGFKDQGRNGQRRLAIIMSVGGYICGVFYSAFSSLSRHMLIIYLTYLISGIGIAAVNKFTGLKASGHACGIMGPIILLVYYMGPCGLLGLVLYSMAFVSSVLMKRHTVPEFLSGSLIPAAAVMISVFITG